MSDENSLKLKLLGPIAESAGNTLQSVWEIVFGGIDAYSKKKQFIREKNFKEFKDSVEKRVAEIPQDAIMEPKLSVIGPTLEASRFYFEEEPLREMFAALVAASVDCRKEKELHPSFPEIIKQMSPLDAENFSLFYTQRPIAEYYIKKVNEERQRTILSNVFISNSEESDLELQSNSIASLVRLGVIETDYSNFILAEKYYSPFFATEYFTNLSQKYAPRWTAGIIFGRARQTQLGKSFRFVCLE